MSSNPVAPRAGDLPLSKLDPTECSRQRGMGIHLCCEKRSTGFLQGRKRMCSYSFTVTPRKDKFLWLTVITVGALCTGSTWKGVLRSHPASALSPSARPRGAAGSSRTRCWSRLLLANPISPIAGGSKSPSGSSAPRRVPPAAPDWVRTGARAPSCALRVLESKGSPGSR